MVENLPDTNVGNIEYISKQDAICLIKHYLDNPPNNHSQLFISGMEDAYYRMLSNLNNLPSADVVPAGILKVKIYKLKCQQDSKNQNYYTGYMSALSTVEGILAEMREE